VLVHGQRGDAEALRDQTASVLEPLGLRLSPAKTQIVRAPRAQEGEAAM
jgi:RNA-directed DNA polymerase